jgi:hypothetical protein
MSSAAVKRQLKSVLGQSILNVTVSKHGDISRPALISSLAQDPAVVGSLQDLYGALAETCPADLNTFTNDPALGDIWYTTHNWKTMGTDRQTAFKSFLETVMGSKAWKMLHATRRRNELAIRQRFGLIPKVRFTEKKPARAGESYIGQPVPSDTTERHEPEKKGSVMPVSNLSFEQGKGQLIPSTVHPDALMLPQAFPEASSIQNVNTDLSISEPTNSMDFKTQVTPQTAESQTKWIERNPAEYTPDFAMNHGAGKIGRLEDKSSTESRPILPPTPRVSRDKMMIAAADSNLEEAVKMSTPSVSGQQMLSMAVYTGNQQGTGGKTTMGGGPDTNGFKEQKAEEPVTVSDLGTQFFKKSDASTDSRSNEIIGSRIEASLIAILKAQADKMQGTPEDKLEALATNTLKAMKNLDIEVSPGVVYHRLPNWLTDKVANFVTEKDWNAKNFDRMLARAGFSFRISEQLVAQYRPKNMSIPEVRKSLESIFQAAFSLLALPKDVMSLLGNPWLHTAQLVFREIIDRNEKLHGYSPETVDKWQKGIFQLIDDPAKFAMKFMKDEFVREITGKNAAKWVDYTEDNKLFEEIKSKPVAFTGIHLESAKNFIRTVWNKSLQKGLVMDNYLDKAPVDFLLDLIERSIKKELFLPPGIKDKIQTALRTFMDSEADGRALWLLLEKMSRILAVAPRPLWGGNFRPPKKGGRTYSDKQLQADYAENYMMLDLFDDAVRFSTEASEENREAITKKMEKHKRVIEWLRSMGDAQSIQEKSPLKSEDRDRYNSFFWNSISMSGLPENERREAMKKNKYYGMSAYLNIDELADVLNFGDKTLLETPEDIAKKNLHSPDDEEKEEEHAQKSTSTEGGPKDAHPELRRRLMSFSSGGPGPASRKLQATSGDGFSDWVKSWTTSIGDTIFGSEDVTKEHRVTQFLKGTTPTDKTNYKEIMDTLWDMRGVLTNGNPTLDKIKAAAKKMFPGSTSQAIETVDSFDDPKYKSMMEAAVTAIETLKKTNSKEEYEHAMTWDESFNAFQAANKYRPIRPASYQPGDSLKEAEQATQGSVSTPASAQSASQPAGMTEEQRVQQASRAAPGVGQQTGSQATGAVGTKSESQAQGGILQEVPRPEAKTGKVSEEQAAVQTQVLNNDNPTGDKKLNIPLLRPMFREGDADIIMRENANEEQLKINRLAWQQFNNYSWEANEEADNPLHAMNIIDETRRFYDPLDKDELMPDQCRAAIELSYDASKEVFSTPENAIMETDSLVLDTRGDGNLTTLTPDETLGQFHDVYMDTWFRIPESSPWKEFTQIEGTQLPDSMLENPKLWAPNDAPSLRFKNGYIYSTLN